MVQHWNCGGAQFLTVYFKINCNSDMYLNTSYFLTGEKFGYIKRHHGNEKMILLLSDQSFAFAYWLEAISLTLLV